MNACARCETTENQERIADVGGMWLCEDCWAKRRCDRCKATPKKRHSKLAGRLNRAYFNQPTVDRGVLCWHCMTVDADPAGVVEGGSKPRS